MPLRIGIQQRVLPLYRAAFFDTLAAQGDVSVFAGQPLDKEGIAPAQALQKADYFPAHNYHFLDPSLPFYLCWQGGLLDWLASWQPDALVVEANPRYLSTSSAARWMHARRRVVLGWGLGAPQAIGRLGWLRRLERRGLWRQLDGIIAYSGRGADEYRAAGFPPERVFTAYNAAAPRSSTPPPERPDAFDGQPRLLFVGRLQARKRVDLLLHVCATLPEAMRPALTIVGDGPERAPLQALAQQVYPQAEFVGAKQGDELAAFFRRADLFVLPGTGGLAVQQAMSFGLPVIVAEGDGTQADLARPGCGWLAPPGDLDALRSILQTALQDPPRLRQMGREAYRIVAEEINLEAMAAQFRAAVAGAVLTRPRR